MQITYIGPKAQKTDNVAGTSTVWTGAGDTKDVPDIAAAKLLKHPSVWAKAGTRDAMVDQLGSGDGTPKWAIPGVAEGDPDIVLDDLDVDTLRQMAKDREVKVHHAAGADKIRDAMVDQLGPQ